MIGFFQGKWSEKVIKSVVFRKKEKVGKRV